MAADEWSQFPEAGGAAVADDPWSQFPAVLSDHSDKWNKDQADMAARAKAAGIPDASDARQRLTDAISRTEAAGFKTPHFIGTPDEPSGDRAVTRDIENLASSLKSHEASLPAGPQREAISKQRAYWEQEAANGMSAGQWLQQTGDPEPLYPHEQGRATPTALPGPGNVPTDPSQTGFSGVLNELMSLPAKAVLGTTNAALATVTGDIFQNPEAYQPTEADLNQPLISGKTAADVLAAPLGGLPQESGGLSGALKGLIQGAGNQVSGLSTGQNLATLPLLAALPEGKLAQRTVQGIFEAQAIGGLKDQWKALGEAKTASEKTRIGTEMAIGLLAPIAPELAPLLKKRAATAPKEVTPVNEAQIQAEKGQIQETGQGTTSPVLTEPAPSVQPAAAPVTPNDFTPALRTQDGEILPGEKGQIHQDIYNAQPDPTLVRALEPEHGFVDAAGNFKTREEVSAALGETTPMQSERLRELQAAPPEAAAAAPVAEPAATAPKTPVEPVAPVAPGVIDIRTEAMRQAALHEPGGVPSQKLGITPPASAFVKEDIARVVSGAIKNTVKGFEQIRNILAPASAGPEAARTANIIRENAAQLARNHEIAATDLENASKAFKKTDNQFNLDVIDKIETGAKQATPELETFSKEIRRQLDERVRQVQAINPSAMQNLIQDYFAHIWTPESVAEFQANPNPVTSNVWSEVFGKRPLEGPKAFLKQRTIPTTIDGVGLGLVPVSWNPVELQLLKLHEMDRYVMGQTIMSEMKDQGLAKFVQAGQPAEPGYVQINDKIARVLAPRDWKIVDAEGKQVPGQKLLGHYYAPEDAARVINNYLSPGLQGNVAYKAFRWLGNIQNQVQLGVSLYHATFTSLDAATSSFSLGLEQLARSGGSPKEIGTATLNIAKGLGEAATGVGGLIENLWRGNKFLREYSRPGTTNADLAHIVDTAIAGGTRIKMDTFYNTGSVKSFFDAIKAGNITGAILRAPFAAIEAAAKPLMQYAVPRMKAGVISQMLEYELSKLPAGATQNDIRTIAGRVVDSVDNRMGQMIYDNLFWNRILKDGLMASVRSVGWNVGDIREIGGGMLDAVTAPARAYRELKGKTAISDNPVVTHRMAYVVGLPLIVGALGSMYQYLMTGQGPESIQDAFMPKTGRKKSDGTDERVMLPTYMKDIAPLAVAGQRGFIPLASRAVGMAQNKLHPTLTMLSQMLHNQDYYGNQIRNVDDGLVQTIQKEALFAIKQWKPFSVQGVMQREGGLQEKLQAVAGIMPAPGELTRTPAMQLIHEINLGKRPAGGYTALEQQHREDKRAASAGGDLRLTLFKRLSQEERDRVLEVATPEEKAIFGAVPRVKHRNAFTIVK